MSKADDILKEDDTKDTSITSEIKTEDKGDTAEGTGETKVDIDTTALQEEVKNNVSRQLVDQMVKSLKGEKEEDDDTPQWEKEKRNPKSWKEVAEYAVKQFDRRQEIKDKQIKEKEIETQRVQSDQVKQWNQVWDSEILDLQSQGLIPKVVNKDDVNDPGVKAVKDLFEEATKMAKEGKLPTKSLKVAFYEGYSKKNKSPTEPVFGSRNSSVTSSDTGPGYSYDEIHNTRSFNDLLNQS